MCRKITLDEMMENMGMDKAEFSEYLTTGVHDGIVPAMCEDGCECEPDGECEHGHPSVLVHMKLI